MAQGIDYTSVSPIFSVLLQFGFVSVVYSAGFSIRCGECYCSDTSECTRIVDIA